MVVFESQFEIPPQYAQYRDRVYTYKDFVNFNESGAESLELENRKERQAPGLCASIVYTSGTTGNPKGVMLSHDNYTSLNEAQQNLPDDLGNKHMVSYLPLSHVAAQYVDLVMAPVKGIHTFFADSNALKGTLIDYLQEVKPCILVAVPRVYEKMEEKVREALMERPRIMNWALGAGKSGHDAIMKGQGGGVRYWLFNKLVY